jgi:CheY-like chemotaxis protein
LFEEPRELLNLVCMDFREMYPNRTENYCCTGGGGAMSMSEYTPRRLKSAKIKADQLKETGAAAVVTSCHNCVDGLGDVIRHYELGMEVTQLVHLVANALVIEEKVRVPVEEEVAVAEPAVVAAAGAEVTAEGAAVAAQVSASAEGAAGPEDEERPFAGRTVLVADDEPDQVDFIATVLEDHGATILRASDGEEALAIARAEKPDLLTLDLGMPGRNVGEVYETIRKDEDLSDLRVCIITGRPELRKLIYDRSVRKPEGYLDKPIDEDGLVLNVKKVLELT